MAYFIYNKTSNNQIYKIAENDFDLSTLIIPEKIYFTINVNQNDFDNARLMTKQILNYNGSVQLQDLSIGFNRSSLTDYINVALKQISYFLEAQPQSLVFQKWFDYSNLLKNLNVENIIPTIKGNLNSSLEQYLQNQGQSSYNILQLP